MIPYLHAVSGPDTSLVMIFDKDKNTIFRASTSAKLSRYTWSIQIGNFHEGSVTYTVFDGF